MYLSWRRRRRGRATEASLSRSLPKPSPFLAARKYTWNRFLAFLFLENWLPCFSLVSPQYFPAHDMHCGLSIALLQRASWYTLLPAKGKHLISITVLSLQTFLPTWKWAISCQFSTIVEKNYFCTFQQGNTSNQFLNFTGQPYITPSRKGFFPSCF